ncbi:MAG: FAD:protein FMN transferase [Colwellia sp.]|nr:FAD:protein FMN transferase [Colwellia sp.]
MGTIYNITYLPPEKPLKGDLRQQLTKLFEQANQSMSTYHNTSEISKFNQSSSTESITISADLRKVVVEGIRLHQLTSGSLDITLKPLSALWGFGPEGRPHMIPSDEALTEVRKFVGVDKLTINGNQMAKKHPSLKVDLNTIGKGYVVDLVAELLESHTINNYMVEIGGEMRLKGHNGFGSLWRVGVIKPDSNERKAKQEIYPGDNAVATSGDYYQYFEQDGQRFSHIIDPVTGKPINHNLASVTVIHPSSMTADGLSTGLLVMGEKKGLEFAEKHHIATYMIIRKGDRFVSKMSTAFNTYLSKEK